MTPKFKDEKSIYIYFHALEIRLEPAGLTSYLNNNLLSFYFLPIVFVH